MKISVEGHFLETSHRKALGKIHTAAVTIKVID